MKRFRQQALRLLVLIMTTLGVIAGVVIFYNPQNGRVERVLWSANTPEYLGVTNVIILTNSPIQVPPSVPEDWIYTNGVLRLMSHEEMAARDLEADTNNVLRVQAAARFRSTNDLALWASMKVLLSLVNTNRLSLGRPAITPEHFIQLVADEIAAP